MNLEFEIVNEMVDRDIIFSSNRRLYISRANYDLASRFFKYRADNGKLLAWEEDFTERKLKLLSSLKEIGKKQRNKSLDEKRIWAFKGSSFIDSATQRKQDNFFDEPDFGKRDVFDLIGKSAFTELVESITDFNNLIGQYDKSHLIPNATVDKEWFKGISLPTKPTINKFDDEELFVAWETLKEHFKYVKTELKRTGLIDSTGKKVQFEKFGFLYSKMRSKALIVPKSVFEKIGDEYFSIRYKDILLFEEANSDKRDIRTQEKINDMSESIESIISPNDSVRPDVNTEEKKIFYELSKNITLGEFKEFINRNQIDIKNN